MDKVGDVVLWVLVVAIGFIMLLIVFSGVHHEGVKAERRATQKELVDRGVAEYDTKTGEWKYKAEFKLPEEAKP